MDIVIPDDYPPTYATLEQPDLQRLAAYGSVRLHTSRAVDRADLFGRIVTADVIINVRAYTLLDDEAFQHAPRLKLISILGTGTDNVDLEAATRRGVSVTNTPGVGAPSVAELTVGLILGLVRAIPSSDARLRAGVWQHHEGPELAGKTLGLLGLGAIGQYVARLGGALGMRVIAWSYSTDPGRADRLGVELVERDDVFRRADVVSVHLRNTAEVRGLVGARELALMKPTAYLINTARGALVDEAALAAALRTRQIAGAALDVYTEEPLPPDSPLWAMDNVIVSPHSASTVSTENEALTDLFLDNLARFADGRLLRNRYEPADGY